MPAPDPSLSPDEAAVRSRLAEARHTEPVPAHVVARLDAVLGDLTADRRDQTPAETVLETAAPAPTPPQAPVVPLASRRRRRILSSVLVAAAAAVAFGVALPQVLDGAGGDDKAASTADSAGSSAEFGARDGSDDGAGAQSAPDGSDTPAEAPRSGRVSLSSQEPLRPAVSSLLRRGPVAAYDAGSACVAGVGPGRRVETTWDGLPAVVVVRPAEAGRRTVDVYVCGSDEVVGSTTLPAR